MNYYIRLTLGLMIISSFITHTVAIDSDNLLLARMTISELFGFLAIFLFGFTVLKNKSILRDCPDSYKWGVFLIGAMLASIITSLSVKQTLFEICILSYLIVLSFVIYAVFKSHLLELVDLLIGTTLLLSIIGLYDVVAVNFGYTPIFSGAVKNYTVSGFRYFGQAANYSFTMLSILIPLKYSNFSVRFSPVRKGFLNIGILLGTLFMLLTGRVSIIISFTVAVVLTVTFVREKKVLKDAAYLFIIMSGLLSLVSITIPKVWTNLIHRFSTRITDRIPESYEVKYMEDNLINTWTSFTDNPLFGSGLGGFVNNYSNFEIHGTLFKLLGETGLIGLLAYILFMVSFLKIVVNRKISYFYTFFPFLLASLLSWTYNYHLRKKEFWILFAFLMLVNHIDKLDLSGTSRIDNNSVD